MRAPRILPVIALAIGLAAAAGANDATFHRFATDGSPGVRLGLPMLAGAVSLAPDDLPGARVVVAGLDVETGRVRAFSVRNDDSVLDLSPTRQLGPAAVGVVAVGGDFATWSAAGDLTLYRYQPPRGFVPSPVGRGVVAPGLADAVAWVDPTAAGRRDAIFYDRAGGSAVYVRGLASRSPALAPFELPLAGPGLAVAVARTGAGAVDAVVVTATEQATIVILDGGVAPPIAPKTVVETGSSGTMRARAADVDGDGDADIFTVNVDGTIPLLLRDAASYAAAPGSPLLVGSRVHDVAPTSRPRDFLVLHGASGRARVRVAPFSRVLSLETPTYERGAVMMVLETGKGLLNPTTKAALGAVDCGAPPRVRAELQALGTTLLEVDSGQERCVLRALRRQQTLVRRVEPNWIARGRGRQPRERPRAPADWVKSALQVPPSAALPRTARGVTVAVVDSGAEGASAPWRNPAERANGVDDDDNGYIDDIFGVDYVDGEWVGDEFRSGPSPLVDSVAAGHGIAVTAAAEYIAAGIEVMSLRVLDEGNETTAFDLALAIVYAAEHGADVINLSVAGADDSELVHDAVRHAWQQGATVVAAAGNEGDTHSVGYPARYREVIAVGALEQAARDGSLGVWAQANTGSGAGFLAPGVDVCTHLRCDTGTSIAAALTSGLIALVIDQAPLCPADLIALLRATARDVAVAGWDPGTGYGVPRTALAVQQARSIVGTCAGASAEPTAPSQILLGTVDDDAIFGGVIQFHGLMTE